LFGGMGELHRLVGGCRLEESDVRAQGDAQARDEELYLECLGQRWLSAGQGHELGAVVVHGVVAPEVRQLPDGVVCKRW
jgi:hypothetical protein